MDGASGSARQIRFEPSQLAIDIPSSSASDGVFFFEVVGTVRLSDGKLVVANSGTHELLFFDSTGELIRRSGRSGDGPGEFRDIRAVWAYRDTLVVYDLRHRRATVFDSTGTLVRTIGFAPTPSGATAYPIGLFDDGSSLVQARPPSPPTRTDRNGVVSTDAQLLRYGSDGHSISVLGVFPSEERQLYEYNGERYVRVPLFGVRVQYVARGNRLYIAASDRYEVKVFSREGELEAVLAKASPRRAATAAIVERVREAQLSQLRSENERRRMRASFRDMSMPSFLPVFDVSHPNRQFLKVSEDGLVWVREYPLPDEEGNRWTVFDGDGTVVAEVEFPLRFVPYHVSHDLVVGKLRDGLDRERIQLYRFESLARR